MFTITILKCDSSLESWWEISVDVINLILKSSAQHLISFILYIMKGIIIY
jgi:hypothetical protein